jgi:hypothetical protein
MASEEPLFWISGKAGSAQEVEARINDIHLVKMA